MQTPMQTGIKSNLYYLTFKALEDYMQEHPEIEHSHTRLVRAALHSSIFGEKAVELKVRISDITLTLEDVLEGANSLLGKPRDLGEIRCLRQNAEHYYFFYSPNKSKKLY